MRWFVVYGESWPSSTLVPLKMIMMSIKYARFFKTFII